MHSFLAIPQETTILLAIALAALITITVFLVTYTYTTTIYHTQRKANLTTQPQTSLSIATITDMSPTVEKHGGLLTPPGTPGTQTSSTYESFLSAAVPTELQGAPVELQQEVLFSDMDPELWAEIFGLSSSLGSSFASVSSLDLEEEVVVGGLAL